MPVIAQAVNPVRNAIGELLLIGVNSMNFPKGPNQFIIWEQLYNLSLKPVEVEKNQNEGYLGEKEGMVIRLIEKDAKLPLLFLTHPIFEWSSFNQVFSVSGSANTRSRFFGCSALGFPAGCRSPKTVFCYYLSRFENKHVSTLTEINKPFHP